MNGSWKLNTTSVRTAERSLDRRSFYLLEFMCSVWDISPSLHINKTVMPSGSHNQPCLIGGHTMTKNDYAQLAAFDPFSIGFDKTFKLLSSQLDGIGKNLPGYPPYNIKKVDDNKYVIEMAVAGFAKTDIELTLDGSKLTISGNTKDSSDMDKAQEYYYYKGIAERAFNRTFTLADTVVVNNVGLMNGILKVWLENIVPENQKPKKINID